MNLRAHDALDTHTDPYLSEQFGNRFHHRVGFGEGVSERSNARGKIGSDQTCQEYVSVVQN
ncbi:MAG: hypothetical protein ACI9W2_000635 [Gammaproteobacteria bacterium]|jgi:hypothetical protein